MIHQTLQSINIFIYNINRSEYSDLEEDLEIDNIKLEPIEIEDIQFKSYTQYKKPPKGKNPIIYGYCLDQGLRNEMEDTYYCKRHIFTDSAKNYFSLFTLCDGHNGLFSSEYASKILPLILVIYIYIFIYRKMN